MRHSRYNKFSEFAQFCATLSAEDIQKMSTAEWNDLYRQLDKLTGKRDKLRMAFMTQYPLVFFKLYANYRPEKKYLDQIKKFAVEMADTLIKEHPELQQDFYLADVLLAVGKKQNLLITEKIRDTLYRKIKTGFLKPKIKVVYMRGHTAGTYKNSGLSSTVVVAADSPDFMATVAHELFHSLQLKGNKLQQKLWKACQQHTGIGDAQIDELYQHNSDFYCLGSASPDPKYYRVYRQQPLEYMANMFSVCFYRRIRKKLAVHEYHYGQLHDTLQIARAFQCNEDKVKVDDQIHVTFTNRTPAQLHRLNELNEKYISGQLDMISEGDCVWHVNTDVGTKIKTSRLLWQINTLQQNNRYILKELLPDSFQQQWNGIVQQYSLNR